MSRHRNWCITINNWKEADKMGIKALFRTAKYGIVGEEIAPTSGTPHLQGYVSLNNPLSLEKMKYYLPKAHLIVAKGTDKENQTYCSKECCNVIEQGTPSEGQGKRNDIHDLSNKIKNKEITIDDVMWDYPDLYARYNRAIKDMFNATLTARTEQPKVMWRWGLAGTGKTRYCIETHPSHYVKDNTSWWDGYNQQEAIIIDDFDNQIPYRTLLRILDRYVYLGQIKGGYTHINSPYIYITSEHPPEYYWHGNELEQVKRRLTSVLEIK